MLFPGELLHGYYYSGDLSEYAKNSEGLKKKNEVWNGRSLIVLLTCFRAHTTNSLSHRFLCKSTRQYFRYKVHITWLKIDEILTYERMFSCMGSFHLVFAVRTPKKLCDYFWPVFWPENVFSPFPYTWGLLVCENEKLNCLDIQCVVGASSFSLNHNI